MKIMVVDDEQDIKLLFEQRFRRETRTGRYQFIFAFDGQGALELLSTDSAADVVLILSDINMPGMSGLELLRQLKAQRPELRVYMITAYSDEGSYEQAMAWGADDFLTKPLDFIELKERLYSLEHGERDA